MSLVGYRLELPARWQIHPTFHASHLKAYIRHPKFEQEVEPPPPVLVDGELEYKVEAIFLHCGKGAQHRCLILWKGYPLSEATWEPEAHLLNAPNILAWPATCGGCSKHHKGPEEQHTKRVLARSN